MCSMGGWQTVREREYEDGFQEKAFWQWDLKEEAHATRTQTTWKFQACFWVLNQWEPFSGTERKGSTRHSEESLQLGQWVTQWMSAPYLSFPMCRENPISCTFFSYFRFLLLLDTFDLFGCHELCPWLHSGKEIAQLGCYIENQVAHKQDLYFAFGHFVSHMGVFSH